MKTVLITGAAGFLGRYVVQEMLRSGWSVVGLDGNVAPSNMPTNVIYRSLRLPNNGLFDLVGEFRPNACVHCAGRASIAASVEDPAADFQASVIVTAHLLDALQREASGCRTIFLSSAAVYGQPDHLPVRESASIKPLSPYGYHKRICEVLVEEAARLKDIPAASVRIFSAYGPGLRRQVLWEVASQLAEKNSVHLRGTGDESRDFIYASDVARAIRLLIEKAPCEGEVYNVAAGTETTIKDAVEMLREFFPVSSPAIFAGKRSSIHPERWLADCSRIQQLGFGNTLSLSEGLQALVQWVQKNVQYPIS